jgi:hypothetical protein
LSGLLGDPAGEDEAGLLRRIEAIAGLLGQLDRLTTRPARTKAERKAARDAKRATLARHMAEFTPALKQLLVDANVAYRRRTGEPITFDLLLDRKNELFDTGIGTLVNHVAFMEGNAPALKVCEELFGTEP